MKTQSRKLLFSLLGSAALMLSACEKTDRSFSLLNAESSFQQAATYTPRKIDILWVVDNSGSMDSSQQNLLNSFNTFISRMQGSNYDFHMAITGTDAWRSAYLSNATNKALTARARTGAIKFFQNQSLSNCDSTHPLTTYENLTNSGINIMTNLTPNLSNVFLTNAYQGTCGTGDERAFASFKEFLNYNGNSDFRRPDAVLAIIIVSDEDDFSVNTSANVSGQFNDEVNSDPIVLPASSDPANIYNLYNDSRLYSVQSYKDFLDTYAGTGNYSVNMIGVLDQSCKADLNASYQGRRIGRRYMQLADMTGGVKTSLCSNFGESLQLISDSILSLASVFKLDREPLVETIQVIVNGTAIPSTAWQYHAEDMTITFQKGSEPAPGDSVQIYFTPARAAN